MAVTIPAADDATFQSVSPVIPAAGVIALPAHVDRDLILLVWTGVLSATTQAALAAYQITTVNDGTDGRPASSVAVKVSDGTDTTIDMLWVGGGEQHVGVIILRGAALGGRDEAVVTGTASAVDAGSVNLGPDSGIVLVWDVVSKTSPVGPLAAPAGYTELFHTEPAGSFLNYSTVGVWYLLGVTGAQNPGAQDDVSPGSWAAATLSFLDAEANITDTAHIRVSGVDVSVPGPTVDEPVPVPFVSQFAREPFPSPPDPTSIPLPTPPWIPDGQYRRNDVD